MIIISMLQDKTVFMFKQSSSVSGPQKIGAVCQMVDWACLSFQETDKIRWKHYQVIIFPNIFIQRFCTGPGKQTSSHETLKENIRSMLSKLGARIIQREKSFYSGWEWKIIGTPFSGTFGTGNQQRSMISVLCQIIKSMNSCGWKLGIMKGIFQLMHSFIKTKFLHFSV